MSGGFFFFPSPQDERSGCHDGRRERDDFESSQLVVLLQGHFIIDTSCPIYGGWDRDITFDNWWPVSECVWVIVWIHRYTCSCSWMYINWVCYSTACLLPPPTTLPVSGVGLWLGAQGSVATETALKQTKGWNRAEGIQWHKGAT